MWRSEVWVLTDTNVECCLCGVSPNYWRLTPIVGSLLLDCCMLAKLWFSLTWWPPRKHLHLFWTGARLSAGTCWGRPRYAPAATGNAVGTGGKVSEGEPRSRCCGWKRDERLSQVVLLRFPWWFGWAVTFPGKSKNKYWFKFTNYEVEQQIWLQSDKRLISAFSVN